MGNILTTKELADLMGVSTTAVNKRIKAGSIKATMDASGNYKINISDLSPKDQKKITLRQKRAVREVKSLSVSEDIQRLEKSLWEAADALRGTVDSSQYKEIVLGLIFLKYVSDVFAKKEEEIKASKTYKGLLTETEREAYLEDGNMYRKDGSFYVIKQANWDYLKKNASRADIATLIDQAMEAIERDNDSLIGVLPREYVRSGVQPQTLSELINTFFTVRFFRRHSTRTRSIRQSVRVLHRSVCVVRRQARR